MGLIPREWLNLFKEGNMFPNSNEIQKTRKKYNSQMYHSGINSFGEIGEVEASAL